MVELFPPPGLLRRYVHGASKVRAWCFEGLHSIRTCVLTEWCVLQVNTPWSCQYCGGGVVFQTLATLQKRRRGKRHAAVCYAFLSSQFVGPLAYLAREEGVSSKARLTVYASLPGECLGRHFKYDRPQHGLPMVVFPALVMTIEKGLRCRWWAWLTC